MTWVCTHKSWLIILKNKIEDVQNNVGYFGKTSSPYEFTNFQHLCFAFYFITDTHTHTHTHTYTHTHTHTHIPCENLHCPNSKGTCAVIDDRQFSCQW